MEDIMNIKKNVKKIKQRFRPLRSAKIILRKKKNQRRLLLAVGAITIAILSAFLVQGIQKQNSLREEIVKNQADIKKAQNNIVELQDDVSKKQKTLEANDKTIKADAEKQNELEKKIEDLNKQITNLKSAYGGYGGAESVGSTSYTAGNSYTPGNCTWGVKNWKPEVPNFWGNANQWDDSARASGIRVDGTPTVGAVAQTDAGWAGHVAMVIAVDGNNVTIKEMNYGSLYTINTRTVSSGEFVYIHV